MKIKIGVLTPTRGDRPAFLHHSRLLLDRQTRRPDLVALVDEPPRSGEKDVTYRYRRGCEDLAARGADLIVPIEDDDYYGPTYLETLEREWLRAGRPPIIGYASTIYYNILTHRWARFNHPGRASMMATAIAAPALRGLTWCADTYPYTDLHLWTNLRGATIPLTDPPACIGIKHGFGLCGGGGHTSAWAAYRHDDPGMAWLRDRVAPASMQFYTGMTQGYNVVGYKMVPDPFLTIVTRVMVGRRPKLFQAHQRSVAGLQSPDFEQVFIQDHAGLGLHSANRAFQLAKPAGRYVHLLDDDDLYLEPRFIQLLKEAATLNASPDVIVFRMRILTGDGDQIYPKPESWEQRAPKRAQIGGSCFVVKGWVYDRHIRHFDQPSFGDWHFITRVMADPEVRVAWLDHLMCETGRVSRGRAES